MFISLILLRWLVKQSETNARPTTDKNCVNRWETHVSCTHFLFRISKQCVVPTMIRQVFHFILNLPLSVSAYRQHTATGLFPLGAGLARNRSNARYPMISFQFVGVFLYCLLLLLIYLLLYVFFFRLVSLHLTYILIFPKQYSSNLNSFVFLRLRFFIIFQFLPACAAAIILLHSTSFSPSPYSSLSSSSSSEMLSLSSLSLFLYVAFCSLSICSLFHHHKVIIIYNNGLGEVFVCLQN